MLVKSSSASRKRWFSLEVGKYGHIHAARILVEQSVGFVSNKADSATAVHHAISCLPLAAIRRFSSKWVRQIATTAMLRVALRFQAGSNQDSRIGCRPLPLWDVKDRRYPPADPQAPRRRVPARCCSGRIRQTSKLLRITIRSRDEVLPDSLGIRAHQ